jgi:hypothetical protein
MQCLDRFPVEISTLQLIHGITTARHYFYGHVLRKKAAYNLTILSQTNRRVFPGGTKKNKSNVFKEPASEYRCITGKHPAVDGDFAFLVDRIKHRDALG